MLGYFDFGIVFFNDINEIVSRSLNFYYTRKLRKQGK